MTTRLLQEYWRLKAHFELAPMAEVVKSRPLVKIMIDLAGRVPFCACLLLRPVGVRFRPGTALELNFVLQPGRYWSWPSRVVLFWLLKAYVALRLVAHWADLEVEGYEAGTSLRFWDEAGFNAREQTWWVAHFYEPVRPRMPNRFALVTGRLTVDEAMRYLLLLRRTDGNTIPTEKVMVALRQRGKLEGGPSRFELSLPHLQTTIVAVLNGPTEVEEVEIDLCHGCTPGRGFRGLFGVVFRIAKELGCVVEDPQLRREFPATDLNASLVATYGLTKDLVHFLIHAGWGIDVDDERKVARMVKPAAGPEVMLPPSIVFKTWPGTE